MAWGALERDAGGCYRVGLRQWEIASLAPCGMALRERAPPLLGDLSQVTVGSRTREMNTVGPW